MFRWVKRAGCRESFFPGALGGQDGRGQQEENPLSSATGTRRRCGFTLLEILVVVLIITILATVVGINVAREPARARVAATRAQLQTVKTALNLYRMDNGFLPTQEQGLMALCRRPDRPPIPQNYREGGYLESRQVPRDGWGREFVYLVPGPEDLPFIVISYGADGEPGGQGEAADLTTADL